MENKKPGGIPFIKITLGILLVLGWFSFQTNDQRSIKVTRFLNGTIKVVTTPGPYFTWYGKTQTYRKAGEYHFSKNKEEGGSGFFANPVEVTFNRKSSAGVTGFLKYTLPLDHDLIKALDEKYGSDDAILKDVVRNSAREALVQTGPLFTAEEADAPRKGEFREFAKGMVSKGLYKKHVEFILESDPSDPKKKISRQVTKLALNKAGLPVVVEPSAFNTYGLKIEAFNVIDFVWDETTEKLLQKSKQIDMKRILSKAAAVTAQQNAIKEKAEGDARIATANANALVLKKTAVIAEEQEAAVAIIKAKKKFEVAEFAAKEAIEEAKKIKANGRAKALANDLLVRAGLTPEKKALIRKDMMIGMMEAWAKRPVPASIMTTGGSGGGSGQVMLDIMGVKAAKDLMNMNVSNPAVK